MSVFGENQKETQVASNSRSVFDPLPREVTDRPVPANFRSPFDPLPVSEDDRESKELFSPGKHTGKQLMHSPKPTDLVAPVWTSTRRQRLAEQQKATQLATAARPKTVEEPDLKAGAFPSRSRASRVKPNPNLEKRTQYLKQNRPPRAAKRGPGSKQQSLASLNFWVRTCVLVLALGITLILIIASMPRANEVAARSYAAQPESQLKWTIAPIPEPEENPAQPASIKVPLQVTGEVPSGHNGKPVPEDGGGKLTAVPGTWLGTGKGHVYYYRLEIESGVPVDPETAARSIHMILNDPRGWGGPDGQISFTRTDGHADFRIVIATPRLVDTLCAPLSTRGQVSCRNGSNVVLNANKWVYGAKIWPQLGKTVNDYRIYQVSHETGHWLGHGHVSCPSRGALAPTMKQQSADSGQNDGCIPNGWPNPSAKLRKE